MLCYSLALLALPLVQAAILSERSAGYNDAPIARTPSSAWFHSSDHPVHRLFKRQSIPTDGVTYAPVGSTEWTNAYPPGLPDTSKLPQEWVNALNAAVAAGSIPNLAPSLNNAAGVPTYKGLNPNSPQVCSGTYQCQISGDIWNAPEGYIGLGFDDGPLPPSAALYDFLLENNQHATHFFIGTNILYYPKEFLQAFQTNGDDIAVHTWTHPYMTTLTNIEIVAQLGWTMELMHNSTGGRLPRFWRPPYGDTDIRVHAIAKEIFGLTGILWNQDTGDWMLPTGTTLGKINASMTKWLTGPKNPGLIILEHELTNQSVEAFISAYPVMKANGWNITSAAQLAGNVAYQNAAGSTDPVTPADGVILGDINSSEAPTTTATATSASSSTTNSSNGGNSAKKTGSGIALRSGTCLLSWMLSGVAAAMMLV